MVNIIFKIEKKTKKMSSGELEDLTVDDLGNADVEWSELFLLLLKEVLKTEGCDTGKPISEGLRKSLTASYLFECTREEEFTAAKMTRHARGILAKVLKQTAFSPEIHVKNVYLVRTTDDKNCVVFALFVYEFVSFLPRIDSKRKMAAGIDSRALKATPRMVIALKGLSCELNCEKKNDLASAKSKLNAKKKRQKKKGKKGKTRGKKK